MKPILNKWQLFISLNRDYRYIERGWKIFQIAIIKIIKKPEKGVMINKSDYKGFWIKFAVWFPFDTTY